MSLKLKIQNPFFHTLINQGALLAMSDETQKICTFIMLEISRYVIVCQQICMNFPNQFLAAKQSLVQLLELLFLYGILS